MKTDVGNSLSGHLIDTRWALWASDWPQERDLGQTLLFTSAEPLLAWRLSLVYQHPAKLGSISRGAAIPTHSLPQDIFSSVSGHSTISLRETDPLTLHREPGQGLSRVRDASCTGRRAAAGVAADSLVLTRGPAPVLRGQAWTSEDRGVLQRAGDELLFTGSHPGAVSGSELTTGNWAGQPGQAPAAGHRSESKGSRTH